MGSTEPARSSCRDGATVGLSACCLVGDGGTFHAAPHTSKCRPLASEHTALTANRSAAGPNGDVLRLLAKEGSGGSGGSYRRWLGRASAGTAVDHGEQCGAAHDVGA